MQMFYGQVDASTGRREEERQRKPWKWLDSLYLPVFVVGFWLQSLLLPIYLMILCLSSCRQCCTTDNLFQNFIDPRKLPFVTFYSVMVGYVAFLVSLIAHFMVDSIERSFTWIDWIVLLYVTAMSVEEIYLIAKGKLRFRTVTTVTTDIVIVLFCCYFILRGAGWLFGNLEALRVSEHVFAVATAFSFLRLLYFFQFMPRLGPIKATFENITAVVLSYMVILGVALFSFAVAIYGVYNAGIYTTEFRNGSISVPQLVRGLVTLIFLLDCDNYVSCFYLSLWPSLQTMYWSLYGKIDYADLESEHDVLMPETTVGVIVFAFWSLSSIIVLLNMLIALINEAFEKVKKVSRYLDTFY